MCTNKNSKTGNQHLNLINQKFDELDELIINYLNDLRKNGGTTGFCIGSLREKIRYCRKRLNNMCGKFSDHQPKLNSKLIGITSCNSSNYTTEYWEKNLKDYITQKHPDKIKYNPILLKVTKGHIVFGIKKHMGIFIIPKKSIIETLFPNLN
jgi:hypothetical protein